MKLNRRDEDKIKDSPTTLIYDGIKIQGDIKGNHNIVLNGDVMIKGIGLPAS